ncbi:hypothetical protein ABIB40_000209 [Pedobacter sp. UYP30]|uniref:IPT/TIG domain-containing protein n=1 Tax=Pedobacter sp. UYP30 TaxID=1756400 RepID=UPI00339A7702
MKNLKLISFYCLLSCLIVVGISSCKKEEGNGAPTITRVRTIFQSTQNSQAITPFDSTTNAGKIDRRYAIIGNNLLSTKAIYLNGVSIYFNAAYASNTTLQFSIPTTTPFSSSATDNMLKVVTAYGEASIPFIIEQPLPGIEMVNQLAGNAGDIITITGTTFDGLTGVTFGTVPATVLTKSPTVITVSVPAGLKAGSIMVTTKATQGGGLVSGPLLLSGTSQLSDNVKAAHQAGAVFGFTTPIFEDQLENSWYTFGDATVDPTLQKRGTASMKIAFGGGYDNIGYKVDVKLPVDSSAAMKFSLYGGKGTNGKKVHVLLNNNYNASTEIILVEGKWTDYIVPFKFLVDAKSPLVTFVNQITFQEYSGNNSVFNIDDVGIVDVKP